MRITAPANSKIGPNLIESPVGNSAAYVLAGLEPIGGSNQQVEWEARAAENGTHDLIDQRIVDAAHHLGGTHSSVPLADIQEEIEGEVKGGTQEGLEGDT